MPETHPRDPEAQPRRASQRRSPGPGRSGWSRSAGASLARPRRGWAGLHPACQMTVDSRFCWPPAPGPDASDTLPHYPISSVCMRNCAVRASPCSCVGSSTCAIILMGTSTPSSATLTPLRAGTNRRSTAPTWTRRALRHGHHPRTAASPP